MFCCCLREAENARSNIGLNFTLSSCGWCLLITCDISCYGGRAWCGLVGGGVGG